MDRWARIYSLGLREPIQLTEQDYAVYGEALADLTVEQLEQGCLSATKECQFFPKPADVRRLSETAKHLSNENEAEQAWQQLLKVMEGFYYPDFGWKPAGATWMELNGRIRRAVAAAGGVKAIYDADTSQLVWRKKEFVDCFLRDEQLEELGPLLPAPNVAKFIQDVAEKKRLT